MAERRTLTREQWLEEGEQLFGTDTMQWRFVCPVCGHVASAQDYKDAGAPEGAVGFSCIGRWLDNARDALREGDKQGPCNYAGGGLFKLNPLTVTAEGKTFDVFDFAREASNE